MRRAWARACNLFSAYGKHSRYFKSELRELNRRPSASRNHYIAQVELDERDVGANSNARP